MRSLITGAEGLVGSALRRRLSPVDTVATGHRELDVTNAAAVREAVARHHPDVVFNCAVMEVDACERDPQAARLINIQGPRHLAQETRRARAAIVHFSSNYVFDGERDPQRAYTAFDTPKPVNVYGATKWEGERAVATENERSFIIRTSWVYGPGKKSFLSTVASRLAGGERVQAINDTFANTTYVEDLITRVLDIVQRGTFGTYQIVNDGTCTYELFAREAARLVKLPPARAEELIGVVSEVEMKRLARRPRSTPMRCLLSDKLGLPSMRPWQEALADWVPVSVPGR